MKDGANPLFSIIGIIVGVVHAFLPMGEFNEYACKVIYYQFIFKF